PERHDGQHWSAGVNIQRGPHLCCSTPAGCLRATAGAGTRTPPGTRPSAPPGTRNACPYTTSSTLSGRALQAAFATTPHALRALRCKRESLCRLFLIFGQCGDEPE